MSGALVQLVAQGIHNSYLVSNPIRSVETVENFMNLYPNNKSSKCIFQRNSDMMHVINIIFHLNISNMTLENFKNIMKESVLKFYITDLDESKEYFTTFYNMSTLMELNEMKKIGNDIVITLPKYLIPYIISLSQQYCKPIFEINKIDTSLFDKIGILNELTFFNTVERRNYAGRAHNTIIQTLSTWNSICNKNGFAQVDLDLGLDIDRQVKGYLVESDHVAELNSIELYTGNKRKLYYNKESLDAHSIKISDRLIYVGITKNNTYKNINYIDHLNFIKHEAKLGSNSCKVLVNFDNKNEQIPFKLHAVCFNALSYMGGFCGKYTGAIDSLFASDQVRANGDRLPNYDIFETNF